MFIIKVHKDCESSSVLNESGQKVYKIVSSIYLYQIYKALSI